MGATTSVVVAIVPEPLDLDCNSLPPRGPHTYGSNKRGVGGPLPMAYRHLSIFPVLAKVARGPVRHHPNERITHFLKEHAGAAAVISDFLTVRDRLAFMQTHKVGLPPKLLKPLLFNGPSREMDFLYCPTTTTTTPTSTTLHTNDMSKSHSHSPITSSPTCSTYSTKDPTHTTLSVASAFGKNQVHSAYLNQCLQLEIRYRGSFLSRAVPLRLVAHALHRVIRSWLDNKLGKRGFSVIMAMVNKLLSVFRPTEEVWYSIVNNYSEDGTTLLTYACAQEHVSLAMVKKLLEIPCFDLGLPDKKEGLTPIQLAERVGRRDLLEYFISLVEV